MNRHHVIRLAVAIALLAPLTHSGTAQIRTQVLVGLNGTTFSGDTSSNTSFATQFSGGIGVGYVLPIGLFVEQEVLYAVKGASLSGNVSFSEGQDPVAVDARSSITYFDFPLLFGYQFSGKSVRPQIYAGPYLGYKLNSKISFRSPSGGPQFSETDDSVEDWDYGFAFGIALQFLLAEEDVAVGFRSAIGLADITRPTVDSVLDPAFSNRSYGVYASVSF